VVNYLLVHDIYSLVLWYVVFNILCDGFCIIYKEWEGRMNVGMSNSVTTAIRDSIRIHQLAK